MLCYGQVIEIVEWNEDEEADDKSFLSGILDEDHIIITEKFNATIISDSTVQVLHSP